MQVNIFKLSWCAAAIGGLAAGLVQLPAQASSHREAPFVTGIPKVDGTDFYMFRSYENGRDGYVTLIANYQPLEASAGSPNYYQMDPNALYEIHIDNNADGKEDITFQFRFTNANADTKLNVGGKQVSIALSTTNLGDAAGPNSPALNVRETYTVKMVKGDRRSGTVTDVTNAANGVSVFDKPFDNIGSKTFSNYAAYAAKHVYNVKIPGCGDGRVFVGQRKDPFVVNLGQFFDNYNIAMPATAFGADAEKSADDTLKNANVTAIELEVPISCLTVPGGESVIGGWTTASVRQGRLMNPTPRSSSASKEGGAWVQVSRLGMPLVNELIIGLKDKDQFNASKPKDDVQFLDYVTNPSYTAVVEQLYSGAGVKAPTNFPRNDLIATFLTGIKGVNQPAKPTPSEMLRLNTAAMVTPVGKQNRLGVIGGDGAGFPNGRRPGDDIVDVVLRVAMGRLCTITGASDALAVGCQAKDAPAGAIDFTDGAYLDESSFDPGFPYLRTPVSGSAGRGAAK